MKKREKYFLGIGVVLTVLTLVFLSFDKIQVQIHKKFFCAKEGEFAYELGPGPYFCCKGLKGEQSARVNNNEAPGGLYSVKCIK